MTVIGSAYVNIRAITDKLESDIRSSLESITDSISIHVDADVSSATAKLDELANKRLEDQTITVDADTTQASADLRTVWSESFNATIQAEADTLAARIELDDMADDIHPRVIPNVDTAFAEARLALLTRIRSVRVAVKMNSKPLEMAGNAIARMTGARVLVKDIGGLVQHFVNIDKAVPGIAKAATMIGSIGAMAISSIGGLSTLGGSLVGIINMIGIAGPGMAAGFIVGIGSLMVALKDFSKQLPEVSAQYKTLGATIKSNFWDAARDPIREMAQTLFPSFQKGLADTGGALGRWSSMVAKSIQGSLTQNGRLEKMFGSLNTSIEKATIGSGAAADSLLVMGEAGGAVLPRLADWFTEISVRFNTFIKQSAANGDLQYWIDNGIESLKKLGDVIFQTAGIFNKIEAAATKAGSDGLGTILSFVTRLNSALATPEGMLALTTIFEGANTAASALGDGFFKILGAVGSAAPAIKSAFESVGGVINVVSDAISKVISNPEFQAGFTAMFDGIEKGFGALMPVIGTMGPKFGAFLSIIGSLAANIGGVLAAALEATLPLITALKKAIDPLIPILGDALIKIIQALAPVFDMLANAISGMAPIVSVVVGVLADFISGLVQGLGPALPVIVGAIMALVAGFQAFTAVGTVVGVLKLVSGGLSGLPAIIAIVRTAITLAAGAFRVLSAAMMANPIGLVVGAIAALVTGFILAYNNIGWFKDGVDAAMKWVGEAIGNLVSFWNTEVVPMWNNAMSAAGDFFGAIGAWVGDAIKNVQDFFGGFGKGAGEASGAVGGFFDGIGSTISGAFGAAGDWFAGIGKGISDAFNGVVDFISGVIDTIVSIITTGVQIYIGIWVGAFTIISDVFKNIWNGLVWFFQPIVDLIAAIITGTIDIIMAVWTTGWEIISTIFYGIWINLQRFFEPILQGISDFIASTVNAIVAVWNTTWQAISDFFAAIWNGLVAFYAPILQGIWDFIVAVGAGISLAWNTAWQAIGDFFTTIWNNMVAFYAPILQSIWDFIVAVGAGIAATWNAVWQGISDFFTGLWNGIVSFVQGAVQNVSSVITNVVNNISAGWNATWSAISNYVSAVWSGIVGAVSGFVGEVQRNVQNVLDTIGRIGSDIVNNVSNFGNLLISAGRDLINGLTQGIQNSSGAVVEKIKEIAAGALDAIKSFFGIKSPSRVMRDQVGKQLGLGLAIGIEASIGAVLKATDKLAAAAVPDIADIMLPAVRTASVASQRGTTASVTSPALTRSSVTGSSAASDGTGVFGQSNNGGVTNVNFSVNPSPGLNETQIGESAMNYMYWKLSNHSLG